VEKLMGSPTYSGRAGAIILVQVGQGATGRNRPGVAGAGAVAAEVAG
jgi:hypothetical protein